jgi:hypothetical protein
MVTIEVQDNNYVFRMKGMHKIWALRSKITVPKNDVIKAYQDQEELHKFCGFRVGTYVPFVIIAGTYYLKGKKNFWDMTREKNTIIVELKNHYYNKLYIEVENTENAMSLLNQK